MGQGVSNIETKHYARVAVILLLCGIRGMAA
jgi:hypothetical protein